MRREIKMEWNRAVHGWGFRLSLLFGIAIAAIHFAVMIWPVRNMIWPPKASYPTGVFERWMGADGASVYGTLYYFIMPILAAIPYAGSYKEDLKSGYLKNIVLRAGRKNYLAAKFLVCFLTAGIVSVLPLIINFLLTATVLPALLPQASTFYYPLFGFSMWADLFYAHPYFYLLAYACLNFVFWGMLATLSLSAAHMCENLFVTVLVPFIVCISLLAVNMICNIKTLSPVYFLNPGQPAPAVAKIVLAEMAVMLAAGGAYFYVGNKKDLF